MVDDDSFVVAEGLFGVRISYFNNLSAGCRIDR